MKERRQNYLFETWEHLTKLTLYSIRDYFREGGDGSAIPKEFVAVTDAEGYLNNYSVNFWRKPG